jgi:hypothetical protein
MSARASKDPLQAPRPCHQKEGIHMNNPPQKRGTRLSRAPSKDQNKRGKKSEEAVVRRTFFGLLVL